MGCLLNSSLLIYGGIHMNIILNNQLKHLTLEEEKSIFQQLTDLKATGKDRLADRVAGRIALQYSPIIGKAVRKMRGYNLDRDELISEGWLGMSWAIQHFDMEKGFRFSTYARSTITLHMYTYIMKNVFITNVCTNRKNKKLFFKLRELVATELKQSDELTTEWYEKTAAELKVDVKSIKTMNDIMREPYQSLNTTIGDDADLTKQDVLISHYPIAEDEIGDTQTQELGVELLTNALNTLDGRTKDIVISQMLQDDGEKETLETLGHRHDISKERVRQIRISGIDKINEQIQLEMEQRNIAPSDVLNV